MTPGVLVGTNIFTIKKEHWEKRIHAGLVFPHDFTEAMLVFQLKQFSGR